MGQNKNSNVYHNMGQKEYGIIIIFCFIYNFRPKLDININENYSISLMKSMTQQVYHLNAYLTYVLKRKDVITDDIKLKAATRCLIKCASNFGREVEIIHRHVSEVLHFGFV